MADKMDFTDIEHRFDPSYYDIQRDRAGKFITKMFDKKEVKGLENLAGLSNNDIVIYMLMHKSHIDYQIFPYIIDRKTDRNPPAIAAGDNLIDFPLMGEGLRKSKAFKIYRDPRNVPGKSYKDVLRAEKQYIADELLGKKEDCLFFPEGKRSDTGKLLQFNEAVLNILLAAQVMAGVDIYFVTAAINYERVAEDRHFRTFEKYKSLRKEGKPSLFNPKIIRYAIEWFKYYGLDLPMIHAQCYVRGLERSASIVMNGGEAFYDPRRTTLGNFYMNVGKPHLVSFGDAKKHRKKLKTSLSVELRREVGRLIEILPSDLVARAFQKFMTLKETTETKKRHVLAEMERLRESYINRGYKSRHIEGDIVDVFNRGMLVFASPFRGAIFSCNGTLTRNRRRKHIIAYYASRLDHFEEEGMSINDRATETHQKHSDSR
ncbi:MAG: 1-acyl-sn-glycerol-3-phosphate acyltransferase [Nanoarchaeota archaeon]|nr:1-acyl-sn-glycerol-3-phosphate acyltransferase [Nanoarchaeota archaeon]